MNWEDLLKRDWDPKASYRRSERAKEYHGGRWGSDIAESELPRDDDRYAEMSRRWSYGGGLVPYTHEDVLGITTWNPFKDKLLYRKQKFTSLEWITKKVVDTIIIQRIYDQFLDILFKGFSRSRAFDLWDKFASEYHTDEDGFEDAPEIIIHWKSTNIDEGAAGVGKNINTIENDMELHFDTSMKHTMDKLMRIYKSPFTEIVSISGVLPKDKKFYVNQLKKEFDKVRNLKDVPRRETEKKYGTRPEVFLNLEVFKDIEKLINLDFSTMKYEYEKPIREMEEEKKQKEELVAGLALKKALEHKAQQELLQSERRGRGFNELFEWLQNPKNREDPVLTQEQYETEVKRQRHTEHYNMLVKDYTDKVKRGEIKSTDGYVTRFHKQWVDGVWQRFQTSGEVDPTMSDPDVSADLDKETQKWFYNMYGRN